MTWCYNFSTNSYSKTDTSTFQCSECLITTYNSKNVHDSSFSTDYQITTKYCGSSIPVNMFIIIAEVYITALVCYALNLPLMSWHVWSPKIILVSIMILVSDDYYYCQSLRGEAWGVSWLRSSRTLQLCWAPRRRCGSVLLLKPWWPWEWRRVLGFCLTPTWYGQFWQHVKEKEP